MPQRRETFQNDMDQEVNRWRYIFRKSDMEPQFAAAQDRPEASGSGPEPTANRPDGKGRNVRGDPGPAGTERRTGNRMLT